MKKYLFSFWFIAFFAGNNFAQALKVIDTEKAFKASIDSSANNEMVDIKKLIPSIILDLRYATANNFMNYKLYYNATTTYMRKQPANGLLLVQKLLNEKGLGIKIFDAYRPYSITKKMWELIQDVRYVANPAQGSGHNRGVAIDLTIIDLKTNKELNMGTGYDNFTDSAHHSFTPYFSAEIIANRTLLLTTMMNAGFKKFDTEWWHYSWTGKEQYDVLDFSFKKMKKLTK